MPFCTPDELSGLWAEAGLDAVAVAATVVGADYHGFDDLWRALESGVGPSGAYAVALAPEQRAALRDELQHRLGVTSAPFRLTARGWIVTGHAR
jgi:hypothetical protein